MHGSPRKHLFGILAALALASPCAHAISQVDAILSAAAIAKQGSDNSLQDSTTNAMRAMLDLNNQDQPGAVDHGYKAFGQYKNSQGLDADRIRNRIHQIDLFTTNLTVDSPVPKWATTSENFNTTYARLDPAFLQKGEAGKVAAEFEAKSGMSRTTFLKRMAEASESTISADDPNLTGKVLKKFERFVDGIPNDEFRNRVKEQIENASAQTKTAIVMNGAKHVFEELAKKGIDLGHKIAAALPADPGEADRNPASAAPAAGAPQAESAAPAPRKEDPFASARGDFAQPELAPHDAEFRGLDNEKFSGDPLGRIMQTAMDEQGELTIFKQISRRYRAIAPNMKPATN